MRAAFSFEPGGQLLRQLPEIPAVFGAPSRWQQVSPTHWRRRHEFLGNGFLRSPQFGRPRSHRRACTSRTTGARSNELQDDLRRPYSRGVLVAHCSVRPYVIGSRRSYPLSSMTHVRGLVQVDRSQHTYFTRHFCS